MKRDPVYEGGRITGHNVHYPAVMMTVRDARGYEQFIPAVTERLVFEPIARQRRIFENED